MYNGYEIWKSDAEKCARYRHHQRRRRHVRALHEDLPLEPRRAARRGTAWRWLAMNVPGRRRGSRGWTTAGPRRINPVKKWWWDIELDRAAALRAAKQTNARGLNRT
jgi:hypothetical protein